jgi:Flp pilus assembly protein TadG
MLSRFRQFLADEGGNFAIMTGLLIPLVLTAAGVGLDYGMALTSAQKLNAAAQARCWRD